jgi:clan AA aspartic protease
MQGTVIDRRPMIPLDLLAPDGQQVEIEAVLDTGFSGFLSLPVPLVNALALPFLNYFRAFLADGSSVRLSVHAAAILWDDDERDVEVLATGRQPLIGTAILDGHDVTIEFMEGGPVTIEPL